MNNLTIKDINLKKVGPIYPIVYIIKNTYKISKNGALEDNNIYTIIGYTSENTKHVLYVTHEKIEKTRMWLDVFETLKHKGIENILYLSFLEDPYIKKTAKISFPDVITVPSLVEVSNLFYQYTSERSSRTVTTRLNALLVAEDVEAFDILYSKFNIDYNNPLHNRLKEKYLKDIRSIYKYSLPTRKLIFSQNKNIEIYNTIRINTLKKNFESLNDVYTYLETLIDFNFSVKSFSKNVWISILDDLMVQYSELNWF